MDAKKKSPLPIIILIVVAAAVGGGIWYVRNDGVKVRKLEGTVTHVDLEARTAAMEVLDPRSGAYEDINGEVPEDCPITINGEPAKLSDLKVGDKVLAKGRAVRAGVGPDGKKQHRVLADWVKVTR